MKRELNNSFLHNDAKAPFSSVSFVFDNQGNLDHCKIEDEIIRDQERIKELQELINKKK